MQNVVPAAGILLEEALADKALAGRRDAYAAEVRKLIDAAFAVTRRTGSVEPQVRDIVREAGLSNQAFYRHFDSKDALMLALLADGRRRLVTYVGRQMRDVEEPRAQLRQFIASLMTQARDANAAAATRPFAINAARLAARYPAEVAARRADLLELVRPAVLALGGTEADVELVHDLAMTRMNDAIVADHRPDDAEVEHLVRFCLGGIKSGT
jgi:AcrR family transcriptional regulator